MFENPLHRVADDETEIPLAGNKQIRLRFEGVSTSWTFSLHDPRLSEVGFPGASFR